MKTRKLLLFTLALALIVSLLTVIPSADSGRITISDDYSTVTYNGKEYVHFPELSYVDCSETFYEEDFKLTAEQSSAIYSISADVREGVYLSLNVTFNKGGRMYENYICVDYLDEYQHFTDKGGAQYLFDDYRTYETVYVDREDVFKNGFTLNSYELLYFENYAHVTSTSADGLLREFSGYILYDHNGGYYYYDLSSEGSDTVTIWKLDTAIFEDEDDNLIDMPFESDFMLGFSTVIISFFFGAIPLAGLIVCLVLSFKSKQPYRRGLRIVTLLCAAEIVTFIVTLIVLLSA